MESVKASSTGTVGTMNLAASNVPPAPSRPPAPGTPIAAPLAPPPVATGAAAAPPTPAASAPPLAIVLDELVGMVGDQVHGALLASVDGFAIARSSGMPNSAAHAAMLAAGMGIAHQLASMGGGTELRQLVVDHDGGLLLLWPIGTARVLALVTTRSVDQAVMRRSVQSRVHWLAGVAS